MQVACVVVLYLMGIRTTPALNFTQCVSFQSSACKNNLSEKTHCDEFKELKGVACAVYRRWIQGLHKNLSVTVFVGHVGQVNFHLGN